MTQEETWLLKEKYNGEETDGFSADCERLREGVPLAYVIGYVPFLDTTISLDSHPLIPRPETEFWTSRAIELMKKHTALKVLDLCAGSGCIGVSVLKALPHAFVDFAEIDEAHHETISKNIVQNGIDVARSRIFGGDLFEHIADRYDAILSNPPYIDPHIDRAEDSVKRYEPHAALYGGKDGLEFITRILTDAQSHLLEAGILFMEHEPEQEAAIRKEAARLGYAALTHEDQYGIPRYTAFTRAD
jgi:release factor glutamine methyltransferase